MESDPEAQTSRVVDVLDAHGLHAALRLLNQRTPHRFTGIYRYDGDMLRNVMLFDQFSPDLVRGGDAPMRESYCELVHENQGALHFADARVDARSAARSAATPVISYCGVQLWLGEGAPFGTLCHYDLQPCEERVGDIELLKQLAPKLVRAAIAQVDSTGA